ncbi:MAG TPA: DUF3891 family protein [Candidatus Eisenbacteria bacterium]|nr:DUF3891 family protein [Candidatus Eisenbacteria bacterium]
MIVREEGDQLVLVRQTDHALLSGWLAAAWGAPPWTAPRPYDSCVVGARLHDLAWAAFDEALPRRPDGRPYAFHEVARAVSTRLYVHGLDAVEAIDPYAGLLASLHFSGFFTSHWDWRHGHRPPSLEGEEGAAVDRFVAHERVRQRRLRDRLGVGGDRDRELMCAYVWLQLWDRVSLDVCRHGFHGWSAEYPPAPVGFEPDAEVVRLRVTLERGGVCRLDPYPLLPRPYRARVPAVRVPLAATRDAAELRRAWRSGGGDSIEVTFEPR